MKDARLLADVARVLLVLALLSLPLIYDVLRLALLG